MRGEEKRESELAVGFALCPLPEVLAFEARQDGEGCEVGRLGMRRSRVGNLLELSTERGKVCRVLTIL